MQYADGLRIFRILLTTERNGHEPRRKKLLNEHDLRDFPNSPYATEPVRLYTLPRDSKFRLRDDPEVFHFGHVDGMYSYCTRASGEVLHFPAFAEVYQVI